MPYGPLNQGRALPGPPPLTELVSRGVASGRSVGSGGAPPDTAEQARVLAEAQRWADRLIENASPDFSAALRVWPAQHPRRDIGHAWRRGAAPYLNAHSRSSGLPTTSATVSQRAMTRSPCLTAAWASAAVLGKTARMG